MLICRSLGGGAHKKVLPNTPGSNPNNLPLLDDKMDWTALVDTATKAINYSEDEQEALSSSDADQRYVDVFVILEIVKLKGFLHCRGSGLSSGKLAMRGKNERKSRSTVILNNTDDDLLKMKLSQKGFQHHQSSQDLNG